MGKHANGSNSFFFGQKRRNMRWVVRRRPNYVGTPTSTPLEPHPSSIIAKRNTMLDFNLKPTNRHKLKLFNRYISYTSRVEAGDLGLPNKQWSSHYRHPAKAFLEGSCYVPLLCIMVLSFNKGHSIDKIAWCGYFHLHWL